MNSFLRSCCCCCIGRKYFDCQDNKKDDLPKSLLKTNKFYDETLGIEKIAVFADDIDRKNLKIGSEKKQVAVKTVQTSHWIANSFGSIDPAQNPSSSCPHLTIEEPTSTNSSLDEGPSTGNQAGRSQSQGKNNDDSSNQFVISSRIPNQKQQVVDNKSLLTKTYSFRRMLSFRGSFRSRDSNESMQNGIYRPGNESLFDESLHRPLQFSFLGQIYAKKSTKRQSRRHSSLRWNRQPNPNSSLPVDCGVTENRFESDEDEDEKQKI